MSQWFYINNQGEMISDYLGVRCYAHQVIMIINIIMIVALIDKSRIKNLTPERMSQSFNIDNEGHIYSVWLSGELHFMQIKRNYTV